jgi:hypothetical protein
MINEAKILELIHRQKETGLNITSFCANEGIPKSSFYYWRKELRKRQITNFIPLLVKNSPEPQNRPAKNISPGPNDQPAHGDDFFLELVYPNGTRLRIKNDLDLDHLRSLVSLFG